MRRGPLILAFLFLATAFCGCDSRPTMSVGQRKQLLERLDLGATYEAVVKELGKPTQQTDKKLVTVLKIFSDNSSLEAKFVDGILTGRYTGVVNNFKGFGSDNKTDAMRMNESLKSGTTFAEFSKVVGPEIKPQENGLKKECQWEISDAPMIYMVFENEKLVMKNN